MLTPYVCLRTVQASLILPGGTDGATNVSNCETRTACQITLLEFFQNNVTLLPSDKQLCQQILFTKANCLDSGPACT